MSDQLFDTGGAGGADGARGAGTGPTRRPAAWGGEGAALRAAIESGRPHSAILYGPPGSGKTTLARIAARMADGAFEEESAVNAGKAEIRGVIERARERRRSGRATVLFLAGIPPLN